MYEFLIDIVAEEEKKYQRDPTFYEREYDNYKTNLGGLPSEPKEMVHFANVFLFF